MKKKLQSILTAFSAVLFSASVNAQCPAGQGQLDIEVQTDLYGYEFYFEITPQGDACGTNTIFSAGNATVGCAGGGAGAQNQTDPGLYANNTTVIENVGCFPLTDCFTLTMVDDYGDGGTTVNILVDGVQINSFTMSPPDNGATFVVDFCMQPLNYDLKLLTASMGTYYTMMPRDHATATTLTFSSDVENAGQQDLTNVAVTAVVNDGTVDVHTATSTPLPLVAAATNNFAMTPDYTFNTDVKDYTITFTGSMTETDEDMSNNTMMRTFSVTDSVLGRAATVQGSLGIGSGVPATENKMLGQRFSVANDDAITSITGFFVSPTVGDSTRFSIWDVDGTGMPGSEMASTAVYTFTAADANAFVTLKLPTPLSIFGGTEYVVVVQEYTNNVTIGTDAVDYEIGSSFVRWDSNSGGAWDTTGFFGIFVDYALYVNFGDIVGVEENNIANASVYPVPSSDIVNFRLSNEVSNMTVNVYGMDGKLVTTKIVSGNNFILNVQDLPKGIYMVELNDNSNREVYRIVKQ